MASIATTVNDELNSAFEKAWRERGFRSKSAYIRYLLQVGYSQVNEIPVDHMRRLNEAALVSVRGMLIEEIERMTMRLSDRLNGAP